MLLRKRNLYLVALAVSLCAMLGSLYYSEIKGLTPCTLCWYQRILMYPIVFLSLIGLRYRDHMLPRYVLPLSLIGGAIAAYHYVIQMFHPAAVNGFINCTKNGVSCTTIDLSYFGFVTIPLLSLIAFLIIAGAMFAALRTGDWK
ncbi:MAG: hypothetical protein A3B30_02495 [Candidatus Komeilibacteria bacterium RIFCSPLOWO2_01_FULL_52_15]|uniref:2-oxoglutarate dehydrogenase n=2 Tax=Candidatus Komeiliibacteriota TaxID=1817908 RepID=A0A1G2BQH9_9BACT|nr:MAG: hypothetical protein A2677_01515 [Candidatus Komeilibacteria bacterium RIFCSPHIGHO2_01_FULL_52_14]OGY91372.1 MAG: hypothetical protein A3B30_02495 [Candidatus Komeilibacteria bacterium RIFCSPLOWO2_01_FULL_52_15]